MSTDDDPRWLRRWPRLTRVILAIGGIALVASLPLGLSEVRAGQVDCGSVMNPRQDPVGRYYEPTTPEEQVLVDCSKAAQPRRAIFNTIVQIDFIILAGAGYLWFRDRRRST